VHMQITIQGSKRKLVWSHKSKLLWQPNTSPSCYFSVTSLLFSYNWIHNISTPHLNKTQNNWVDWFTKGVHPVIKRVCEFISCSTYDFMFFFYNHDFIYVETLLVIYTSSYRNNINWW